MTRKEIKATEKNLLQKIKELTKNSDVLQLMTVSNYVFYVRSNYLHICFIYLKDYGDHSEFIAQISVKPCCYDELFWKIIDMNDNINGRFTLRVNGAFSAPAVKYHEARYVMQLPVNYSSLSDKIIADFVTISGNYINEYERFPDKFHTYALTVNMYQDFALHILALLSLEKYGEAMDLITDALASGRTGGFINNDISFCQYAYEYIIEATK